MRTGRFASALAAVVAIAPLLAGLTPRAALAQAAAALTGQVSSDAEGAMEGVLVSARRNGSTITVTVASDQKGICAAIVKVEPQD